MRVSIFTATHDPKYLQEVYDSINGQTFDEWVILYNNGAKPIGHLFNDPRVKEITIDLPGIKGVGAYKKLACANCTGDILVELDHDDLLMPYAISEIRKAFEDPEVGFVYSNDLIANMDWTKTQRFDPIYGWKYRETEYKGHLLDEAITFEATPASVSRIWFAPDHVRAFRKSIYEKVGGHNSGLAVLDDQDLMCRMYLETKFYHIDKALYVYRVHTDNTWLQKNKEIQDGVWPLYDKYIEPLTLKWATYNGLLKLDLGGRLVKQVGYQSVDLKDADINTDLNEPWPFEDNSVGVIRAFDVFEHLKNPLHTMKELYRVLAPGGYAFIQVPSTDGRGAFQDPTHVSFWNENSFLYYTQTPWAKYIDTPVRFQTLRGYTTAKNEQQVCWTIAHLVSLKEDYRLPGIINI
jgi:SAM-dependent methyltransferase